MSNALIDVLLVSGDSAFRELVARHRTGPGELRCVTETESHQAAELRVRQVWVDLDSAPNPRLPAGARLVYFYSAGKPLLPTLPAGLFVRKPCASVLFEALWADLASRAPRKTGENKDTTGGTLPGWLLEYLDLSLSALCRRMVVGLAQRLGYRYGSLYILDADTGKLVLADTTHSRPLERHVTLDHGESHPMVAIALRGRVFKTERAKDEWVARQLVLPGDRRYADGACLIAPLNADGALQGVLNLCERTRSALSEQNQPLPEIFAFLGRVLHHARRFERVRKEARIDSLTQLFNQRWMSETLQREIRRAERYRTPLSVLMIDLDGMKGVNDRHGHAAGDTLLRALAARIASVLRQFDGAARVGGDEFLVLLPATNIRGAEQVGRRVLEVIRENTADLGPEDVRLAASIGAAEWEAGWDVAKLTEAADQAMYRAKQAGGNRVVCHVSEKPPADA